MTTPNTPANGGQILTWEQRRDADTSCESYMKINEEYKDAEIADLRASLAAPATPLLTRIRDAISTDRCDGESEYSKGVNAAVARHTVMIDEICAEVGVAPAIPTVDRNAARWSAEEICDAAVKAGLGVLECNSLIVTLKSAAPASVPQPNDRTLAGGMEQIALLHENNLEASLEDKASLLAHACQIARVQLALAGSVPHLSDSFKLSLASTEAYDPQSFIDGAKWQAANGGAAQPAAQVAVSEDEQLALMVKVEDYMGAVDWAGTQTHAKCDAAEAAIFAKVNEIILARATPATVKTAEGQQ